MTIGVLAVDTCQKFCRSIVLQTPVILDCKIPDLVSDFPVWRTLFWLAVTKHFLREKLSYNVAWSKKMSE